MRMMRVANERKRVRYTSGAGVVGPRERVCRRAGGANPPGKRMTRAANERERVSHTSGAGRWAPASECVGGAGGAKPPGNE
jgi:hypothetical protein